MNKAIKENEIKKQKRKKQEKREQEEDVKMTEERLKVDMKQDLISERYYEII